MACLSCVEEASERLPTFCFQLTMRLPGDEGNGLPDVEATREFAERHAGFSDVERSQSKRVSAFTTKRTLKKKPPTCWRRCA